MAVNFTTNLGLAKPTEAELARNWVNFTDLVENNNDQIIDQMDVNLQTRVPTTIVAHTSNPSVGAGNVQCEFIDLQGIVLGSFIVTWTDPGIVVGSGEYGIELPFELDASYHTVGSLLNATPGNLSIIGQGYMYDSSAIATSGPVAMDAITLSPGSGKSYARFLPEIYAGKTVRVATNAQPFIPANGDRFVGNFVFKKD